MATPTEAGARPVRVLYVQATGEVGGGEVSLLSLLSGLPRTEVTPMVALLGQGPLRQRLEDLAVPVRSSSIGRRFRHFARTAAAIVRLAVLMRRWPADLVHANGAYSHLFAGPAALLARIPYVFTLHDMLIPGASRLYDLAARIPADLIITPSDAVADQARRFHPGLRRLRTIYNGINLADRAHLPSRQQVRGELGIPGDTPVITVVARLQPWKGQADLLAAAPAIQAQFPSAQFLIVGSAMFGLDGDYPQELRDQVASLSLESSVHFLGQRDDVLELMAASDVIVVPSRLPEPFGIVQLEAMLAERPVVASAAGGSLEVIEHGRTGLLVPPQSPPELAAAVCRLLSDPALSRTMGIAGRERAQRLFTIERMATSMVEAYRSVLGTRRQGQA